MSLKVIYDEPEVLTGVFSEDLGKLRVVVYELPSMRPYDDLFLDTNIGSEYCPNGVVTLFYEYAVEGDVSTPRWLIRVNNEGNRIYGVALNFDNATNFRSEVIKSAISNLAVFIAERDAKSGKFNDIGGTQAGLATGDQEEENGRSVVE